MKCSVCLATFNKPRYLARVLPAVLRSSDGLDREVIVVDDGSHTSETYRVCEALPVRYVRIDRQPAVYRNPSVARNVAYRIARGEVIVAMSDDVEPRGDAIRRLVDDLHEGEFLLATVFNRSWTGQPRMLYGRIHELVGVNNRRPLFFLGAMWRRDLYSIGGNDERFASPGREDIWFADCLTCGRGLSPRWTADAVGWHLHHERPRDLAALTRESTALYRDLVAQATAGAIPWAADGAPWPEPP